MCKRYGGFQFFKICLKKGHPPLCVDNRIYLFTYLQNQEEPQLENYPLNISEIEMKHLRDYKYKNKLLDRWKY